VIFDAFEDPIPTVVPKSAGVPREIDRVMTRLANDTDLKYAQIDHSLFHVNSAILLQLWSGVIQNFTVGGFNPDSQVLRAATYWCTQSCSFTPPGPMVFPTSAVTLAKPPWMKLS
jgi:hypothetical protein